MNLPTTLETARPQPIGSSSSSNGGLLKLAAGATLALILWGVVANYPSIRRYIKMEMM